EVPDSYDYNSPNATNHPSAYTHPGSPYHQQNHQQPPSDTGSPSSDAVMIKIDTPSPLRDDQQRYPKEIGKTLLALIFLALNFFLATVSLSLVHDRVPDRDLYGPLPDAFLDRVQAQDWALDVSEILIMVVVNSCVLLITFHKHRFIVMRRVFLLLSILYMMRSLTMYVTVLPVSSRTYYCSPKSNASSAGVIVKRAFQLISGMGLSINGKQIYCGDYIYSGHTVTLVLGYLVISEYSPKRFWPIHWIYWLASTTGVVMVLVAHGHYTVDVLIAYYVTTRLFWTYHTLANNSLLLKQNGNNYIGREWWYWGFRYFERNVRGPIPLQYDCPLSLPASWTKKSPKLPGREITEQLIRKKSEHNELIIGTLEELSLHQEDIERIEHIGHWCRDLRILLLQSNLIPKLENLNRLKKLEYLNVAINNIERIENLEALEALQKLDLTLNFIGELTSIESLRANYNLRELFLTGNPCTDYPGYREYVITVLPQLAHLDGKEITRSDRLLAAKTFASLRERIVQLEALHKIERDEQRSRVQQSIAEQEESMRNLPDDDERKATTFWQQKSEHCPETRIQMAKFSRRAKESATAGKGVDRPEEPKRNRRLFAECGRPYSLNEPRLSFEFHDEPDQFELDLHVYKYLDTSLVEVDAQPYYVRVTVKGKVFQLALKQEIQPDRSSCQRSQTTGHMLIVMPKLIPERIVKPLDEKRAGSSLNRNSGPGKLKGTVDIRSICSDSSKSIGAPINENELPDLI
uniref:Uncharacterized protein n=1 Tax=Anopheles epiroticus TaxID=199890 RepID=A0A182PDW0_9DIPT